MKSKVVAALVTLGVIVSSCGDGRLSVDEYYAEASTASAVYEQLSDENFDIYQAVVDDALLDFGVRTAGADTPTLVEETALLLEIITCELSAAFEQSGKTWGTSRQRLANWYPRPLSRQLTTPQSRPCSALTQPYPTSSRRYVARVRSKR